MRREKLKMEKKNGGNVSTTENSVEIRYEDIQ